MAASSHKSNTVEHGKVFITIIEARNLPAADTNGKSDPYVRIKNVKGLGMHGKDYEKTKVVEKTLNPTFNESFTFSYDFSLSKLVFKVYDQDRFTQDDFLCKTKVPIESLWDGKEHDVWYPLLAHGEHKGDLHLKLRSEYYLPIVWPGAFVQIPHNRFSIGLGWDTSKKENVDLDSSVSGLDLQKEQKDYVSYHHLQAFNGGIRHQGDNRTGEGKGDDEVIHFDLDKIDPSVQYLVVVVNSFSGVPFTKVKSAYIRLKDLSDNTFAFFRLSEMKNSTALFFGFMYRGTGEFTGKWFFKTTALPVHGRTLEQSLGTIKDNLS